MKKLLLLAVVSTFAISGLATIDSFSTKIELSDLETKRAHIELCKTSIKYAHAYKDTMGEEKVAQTALSYYKKDVVENCGTISAANAS
jgi:maltose-binding protein MalE